MHFHLITIFSISKNTDFTPSKCIAHSFSQLRENKSQLRLAWYYFYWTWICMLAIALSLILWREYKLNMTTDDFSTAL